MRNSTAYVYAFTRKLADLNVDRIMLPDTLGVLSPREVGQYLEWMMFVFPTVQFDFHGHNDYGMGIANNLMACQVGISGIHATVNGLGERAGNASLCETVAAIHDMSERNTRVKETRLSYIAEVVQNATGKRIANNAPVVGADVYTQTCGVHADGDKKGNLYTNPLTPERFSRKRKYALGKLSGKASIDKNLEELGMDLAPEVRDQVLREVIRLGDKKSKITLEDLPFIIADVLKKEVSNRIQFIHYDITTRKGARAQASVEMRIDDQTLQCEAHGDGGYDAFVKVVRKALKQMQLTIPKLQNYEIRIPPGGKTDALVEATIAWDMGAATPLVTSGVDSDQVEAAIEATEKMLNHVFAQRLTLRVIFLTSPNPGKLVMQRPAGVTAAGNRITMLFCNALRFQQDPDRLKPGLQTFAPNQENPS